MSNGQLLYIAHREHGAFCETNSNRQRLWDAVMAIATEKLKAQTVLKRLLRFTREESHLTPPLIDFSDPEEQYRTFRGVTMYHRRRVLSRKVDSLGLSSQATRYAYRVRGPKLSTLKFHIALSRPLNWTSRSDVPAKQRRSAVLLR